MNRVVGDPKTIVLVSSSLGGGGAERVLITMAEYWSAAGHDVVIVTLRKEPGHEYDAPARARVTRLEIIQEQNAFWRPTHFLKLSKLRSALVGLKPDLVISFIDKLNSAVLLALVGTSIPVIATEHLAPWMNPLGSMWERLRVLSYRRARGVVSPTEAITAWFSHRIPGRFETLPYPAKQYKSSDDKKTPIILAVGRLARQKGFDILIHAFARIANRHSEWTVEIAGEGPEREVLEKLIAAKGLQKRVRLLGLVNDPEPLYRRSDIFVLSSRHEAYPMVLCEAMSAGCCIVATDCPTGPREIIGTSEAALLVPPEDDQLLAAALERLLQSPLERAMRRISATHRVQELTPAAIMAQWDLAVERWCDVRS